MRLRTALGLLVCFVYFNQAVHGAGVKVTYSKSGATDGKFLVKTVNPDEVAATTINPNDVATIATNPDDVAAVKSLYVSTNGRNWLNNINWNWMKGDPCTSPWHGITCSTINSERRIVEIDLEHNNLDGTIPTDIRKLSELRTLNLRNNQLNGMLQHAVFQIHTLQYIDLSINSITGPLPTKLSMPNLTTLVLRMNHLTGSITAVWNAPKLQILNLENNQLTGNLPKGISSLQSVLELTLEQIHLTGPLPASYGKLSNLSVLWLYQNRFRHNSIPKSWSGLKSLTDIRLDGLRGSIPSTIAQDWPTIRNIDLGNGQLTGKIPTSICECHHLSSISLNNNTLHGPLPHCICTMRSVVIIDISNNQISGPIPSCIGNMTYLSWIYFSRNNLTGTIPELGANTGILDISHNSFHGALPTSLNNVSTLQSFIINDNHFTSASGVGYFFWHLNNMIYPVSCAMENNPWRCPIPSYVLPSCNATCEPH